MTTSTGDKILVDHASDVVPPLDVMIRTGGDHRLSDFLLWESAYAELLFTPCLWPDFDEARLADAIGEFARRERRFGGLSSIAPTTARVTKIELTEPPQG